MSIHNPACFANHMGLYACEPVWFRQAVAQVKAGRYPVPQAATGDSRTAQRIRVSDDGIAVLHIAGPMFKGWSKFSSANSIELRQAVRQAAQSEDVRGLLLAIDSPGGTVAGTADLADEVRAAAALKPVHAFVEDLTASAAYWVASQAARITATRTSEIGSIGVVTVVKDTSGKAEMDGVRVHVISTGPYKGAFADGAPVSEEHLADLQRRVDDLNAHFLDAVGRGRKMPQEQVQALADGRTHIAEAARGLGLIDSIGPFEDAISALRQEIEFRTPKTSRRRQAAAAMLRYELETRP